MNREEIEMTTNYEKICLNCKWWNVYRQTIFTTCGNCDLSYNYAKTDKNFVCGKFEPATALKESEEK